MTTLAGWEDRWWPRDLPQLQTDRAMSAILFAGALRLVRGERIRCRGVEIVGRRVNGREFESSHDALVHAFARYGEPVVKAILRKPKARIFP